MFDLKIKFLLFVSVLFLGGISAINAQVPNGSAIKANIPTAFVVGDKTFPAGSYTITRTPGNFDSSSLLVLRGDKSDPIIFDTVRETSPEAAEDTCLVFESEGGVEYLSKILVKGESEAIGIPRTKAEVKPAPDSATDQRVTVVQHPGF